MVEVCLDLHVIYIKYKLVVIASLLLASGILYEITSMVRVEVKFIGSDRIGRYIATGKIGIGISVKWRIGATLVCFISISISFSNKKFLLLHMV